jgi:hypothetical protein
MDGWMILILILGFWSSERLDGWRILIWILGFRSPERLDGWKILIRILGFWSPRDRDDEEDLKKSSVVGERERESVCCRALIAQHSFAMFACFLGSNTCSAYA